MELSLRNFIMFFTYTFDFGIMCVTNPILLVPTLLAICVIIYETKYYLQASREAQRIMAMCGSPVYEHFVQTIEGAPVIRAFDRKELQNKKMQR